MKRENESIGEKEVIKYKPTTCLGIFEEELVVNHYYLKHVHMTNHHVMGLVDGKSVPVAEVTTNGEEFSVVARNPTSRLLDFLDSYEPPKK